MGWSGSTFSRVHDWTTDAAGAINIEASRMDEEDDNFASGIDLCIHKGGANTPTADLPMGGFNHTGVANASARNEYASAADVMDQDLIYYLDSGAADAYVITPSPAITAYEVGQRFVMKAAATNTGASTININALGVKTILDPAGAALGAGDILVNGLYDLTYDGTNFRLTSPASSYVKGSRTITAGTGLTGGGDLSANRTISLSHLGIQSLSDPGADRILFWDDDAGATAWLSLAASLAITGTEMAAVPGSIDHDALLNFAAGEHVLHSGVSVIAASGGLAASNNDLSSNIGLSVDVSTLTEFTATDGVTLTTDQVIIDDGGTEKRADIACLLRPIVAADETGTTYSLVETDFGTVKGFSNTGTVTITLPNGLSTGFWMVIRKTGASGTTTLSATTTLVTSNAATDLTTQYDAVTVLHLGSNVWTAWGALV